MARPFADERKVELLALGQADFLGRKRVALGNLGEDGRFDLPSLSLAGREGDASASPSFFIGGFALVDSCPLLPLFFLLLPIAFL